MFGGDATDGEDLFAADFGGGGEAVEEVFAEGEDAGVVLDEEGLFDDWVFGDLLAFEGGVRGVIYTGTFSFAHCEGCGIMGASLRGCRYFGCRREVDAP